MIEIKAYGKIENGVFYPKMQRPFQQAMKDAGNVSDCLMIIQGANKRSLDQNSYAWAMCEAIRVALHTYGWTEFTSDDVYRRIEEKYCKTTQKNDKTGQTVEYIKPLKTQDAERYWQIVEQARLDYNEKLNIYIETPAQFYGMTEEAYDLWKSGAIDKFEAKKMSDKT